MRASTLINQIFTPFFPLCLLIGGGVSGVWDAVVEFLYCAVIVASGRDSMEAIG